MQIKIIVVVVVCFIRNRAFLKLVLVDFSSHSSEKKYAGLI